MVAIKHCDVMWNLNIEYRGEGGLDGPDVISHTHISNSLNNRLTLHI